MAGPVRAARLLFQAQWALLPPQAGEAVPAAYVFSPALDPVFFFGVLVGSRTVEIAGFDVDEDYWHLIDGDPEWQGSLRGPRGAAGFDRVAVDSVSCMIDVRVGESAPALSLVAALRPPTRSEGPSVRTYSPKPGDVQRQWHVIDATDVVLGRLASQTARLLRGKHKPMYAPHVDTGDFVVIVNAGKVALTGNKRESKMAYRHSGYPGGLKAVPYTQLLVQRPAVAVERAVKGMLPHNTLGRQMLSKLKVYAGPEHPHAAQRPVPYQLTQVAQQPAATSSSSSS